MSRFLRQATAFDVKTVAGTQVCIVGVVIVVGRLETMVLVNVVVTVAVNKNGLENRNRFCGWNGAANLAETSSYSFVAP